MRTDAVESYGFWGSIRHVKQRRHMRKRLSGIYGKGLFFRRRWRLLRAVTSGSGRLSKVLTLFKGGKGPEDEPFPKHLVMTSYE